METRKNVERSPGPKSGSITKVLCLAVLCLLILQIDLEARQLFYILDRISTQDGYINEIKCFDLNGVFQYKLFEVDPWKWYDYTCIATDGSTAWLGGGDLGVDSFAIRPGGVGGERPFPVVFICAPGRGWL